MSWLEKPNGTDYPATGRHVKRGSKGPLSFYLIGLAAISFFLGIAAGYTSRVKLVPATAPLPVKAGPVLPVLKETEILYPFRKRRGRSTAGAFSTLKLPVATTREPLKGDPIENMPLMVSADKTEASSFSEPMDLPRATDKPRVQKPFSLIDVATLFSYSRIDSVDALTGGQATLLSGLNTGVSLGWAQHWSEQWQSYLRASLLNTAWQSASTKSIDQNNKILSDFELGAADKLTERFTLGAGVGAQQKIFARSLSSSLMTLDLGAIPYLNLEANYELINLGAMSLGLSAGGVYFLPASVSSYVVNAGQGFYGRIELKHQLETMQIYGGLGFGADRESSSLATQVTSQLSFDFGLRWNVGKK